MSKSFSLARAVLAAGLFAAAGAAGAAELKVGVVNFARLLEEAPQVKAANQALQNEFSNQQKELMNQQKELRSMEEKLNRDAAVMAEKERADMERRARDLQRDLSRKFSEFQEDFNVRRNEELGKLQRVIAREVQQFAREEKYDVVLSDGVLYAAPSLDITAQVLKRLETAGGANAAKPADGGKK
jgi:outer membrane protein